MGTSSEHVVNDYLMVTFINNAPFPVRMETTEKPIVECRRIQEESVEYHTVKHGPMERDIAVCEINGKTFYNISNFSARSIPANMVTATKMGQFALIHAELGIEACFVAEPRAGGFARRTQGINHTGMPEYAKTCPDLEGLYIHGAQINSIKRAVLAQIRLEELYGLERKAEP